MKKDTEARLPGNIRAVIFDMDGLMLDTERLDREHFRRAAADFAYLELDNIYTETIGWNRVDTRMHFERALGKDFQYEKVRERWRHYSTKHADEFGVPVKPGLKELLALLDRLKLPKAVATSTQRREALSLLNRVEIVHQFKTVVAGDEVSNGKPHPEIFLTAAQRLQIDPKDCVVFEDSPAGIRAAHAAGMIAILVPDVVTPPAETVDIAFRVITSLEEAPGLFPVP